MKNENRIIKALTYQQKLYRLALRLLRDSEEAADAVQETYLKLWKLFPQLNEADEKDEALAMTIIKNYCFDQLKSKRWETKMQSDTALHFAIAPNQNGHSQLELKDAKEAILHFISQLPPLQQTIIHLRDIELYELDEIAAITEINSNAVRVNLSRARKMIRQQLTKHYNYYEYAKN
ncbi:MAG: sigma-70 family RNA polymerase sigma factor [Ignavibacteria bacterium]|nr:sigma-70 family RNA polymerase sigma factor [Ignavibacteria bacterium]